MHKNTCSVLRYIKEGILFFILVLMISCQNDFDNNNNKEKETLNLHNNYEIVNGTIKIESKEKLKNIGYSLNNIFIIFAL